MELVILAFVLVVVLVLGIVVYLKMLAAKTPFLDKKRKSILIMDVKELSHDTKRFRLSLGSKATPLGLPIGKHIKMFAPNAEASINGSWNGRPDKEQAPEISRTYTPTPSTKTCGYVDLVIKIYRPGTYLMPDGKEVVWADGGKMSMYLDSKKAGETLEIMGPVGVHEYIGLGKFKVPGKVIQSNRYGLLAGGAGITPMLQLVFAAINDPKDTCSFSMIYANKTENDILCRDIIDDMVSASNGRFKVNYTLDFPPENWSGKRGFITTEMISECLPSPDLEPIILMCGPPPMVEFACKKNLDTLGYPKNLMAAL